MSENNKKFCRVLNYFEHSRVFVSAISGSVSMSAFSALVGVLVGISSTSVRLKL